MNTQAILQSLSPVEQRILRTCYRFIQEDKRSWIDANDIYNANYVALSTLKDEDVATALIALHSKQLIESDGWEVSAVLLTQHLTDEQHKVLGTIVGFMDAFGKHAMYCHITDNMRTDEDIHSVMDSLAEQGWVTLTERYTVVAVFGSTPTHGEMGAASYDEAWEDFVAGKYQQCEATLTEIIESGIEGSALHETRGNCRYKLGNYQGAVQDYQMAIEIDPNDFEVSFNLAHLYHELKQYEESIRQYAHARSLETEPGRLAQLDYNVGGVYIDMGGLEMALTAYSSAIDLDPDFASTYLNRGNTFACLGRNAEAQADYAEALRREPEDAQVAWTVAWSRFEDEPPTEEDVWHLEQIAALDENHYTSHLCYGVIALQQNDLQNAQRCAEQALLMEPDQWDSHFWLAMIVARQGLSETAQLHLAASLNLGLPPNFTKPLAWLPPECAVQTCIA